MTTPCFSELLVRNLEHIFQSTANVEVTYLCTSTIKGVLLCIDTFKLKPSKSSLASHGDIAQESHYSFAGLAIRHNILKGSVSRLDVIVHCPQEREPHRQSQQNWSFEIILF